MSVGTAATMSLSGFVHFPIDLMLSTVGGSFGFPSAGVTVVSTFDSTLGTNGLYFQALRSAGTDTVTKLSGLSDEDPATLSKETYLIDGDLP